MLASTTTMLAVSRIDVFTVFAVVGTFYYMVQLIRPFLRLKKDVRTII